MNTTTFYRSYIDVAHKALAISQQPEKMEHECKRLKMKCNAYTDYLKKFEPFLEPHQALKTMLFTNFTDFRFGVFVEYQLDLCYEELKKIETLKTEIEKIITALRNDFTEEAQEWLPEEEDKIEDCFAYLDTTNTHLAINFLTERLNILKEKEARYLSEKRRSWDAAKAGERQAEEEENRIQKRDKEEQERKEREEKRKKAQEDYIKAMGTRKKR